LTEEIPGDIPIELKGNLIPKDKLIHRGVFSPDFKEYYYTISDKGFERFDVLRIKKLKGVWSKPKKAFLNSEYSEHGMSFSPDGNSLYFSSTRPTNIDGVSATWHIWKAESNDGNWNEPTFVDIPNLRSKLVSHPTVANSGTMYFHASNLDYSEMDIYHSKQVNGRFENAEKTPITMNVPVGKCTPFVSAKEDYLIFASIGNQLDLMISYNDGKGKWSNPKALSERINKFGQGNPFVTPDNEFLFFTSGKNSDEKWEVKWVNIESEFKG